jgi:hypothetical protein
MNKLLNERIQLYNVFCIVSMRTFFFAFDFRSGMQFCDLVPDPPRQKDLDPPRSGFTTLPFSHLQLQVSIWIRINRSLMRTFESGVFY